MRILLGVLALAAIIGGGVAYDLRHKPESSSRGAFVPPPVTVGVAAAKSVEWEIRIPVTGELSTVSGLEIHSQVGGLVEAVLFSSGQKVKKGDVLIRLNTDLERAQLKSYRAAQKIAQEHFESTRALFKDHYSTLSTLESAETQLTESKSEVEETLVTIDRKTIRAPIDGTIGIGGVRSGQVVDTSTPIVNLESDHGLFADFEVPGTLISQLRQGQKVRFTTPAFESRVFSAQVIAVAPGLSTTTRSLKVRARVDMAADARLLPGMFVSGDVVTGKRQQVVVPEQAVAFSLSGDLVYVAVEGKKSGRVAEQRLIRVKERRNNLVAVLDGVKAGEEVVTAGHNKLRPGSPLRIDKSAETAPGPDRTRR